MRRSVGFTVRNKNRNSSINVIVKTFLKGGRIIFAQNINTFTAHCVLGFLSVVECTGTVK